METITDKKTEQGNEAQVKPDLASVEDPLTREAPLHSILKRVLRPRVVGGAAIALAFALTLSGLRPNNALEQASMPQVLDNGGTTTSDRNFGLDNIKP